jgi:hypothetical protein
MAAGNFLQSSLTMSPEDPLVNFGVSPTILPIAFEPIDPPNDK